MTALSKPYSETQICFVGKQILNEMDTKKRMLILTRRSCSLPRKSALFELNKAVDDQSLIRILG
jgi:hypothetical protein